MTAALALSCANASAVAPATNAIFPAKSFFQLFKILEPWLRERNIGSECFQKWLPAKVER
nr:hypothetical protein [Chthoniobacterales bacterium]